jgi:hypothetical protein
VKAGSSVLFRVLLALVGVALALAGLVGAWYAEENYRGARAWEKTRHDLEARGESLDAAHFIPPPIPDDQNLAMAPVFVRALEYRVDPATGLLTFGKGLHNPEYEFLAGMPYGSILDRSRRPANSGDWTTAQPLDLGAFQRYYESQKDFAHPASPGTAADDVLLALTRYEDALTELADEAASRPLTRFPVNWTQRPGWGISFVHGSVIQSLTAALRLRACASLVLGRTDDALRDILLGWRLNTALEQEPALLSDLVALTGRSFLLQPIWEGLASRRWNADQLAELQRRLSSADMLRSLRRAEQFERASFLVPMREELRRPTGFRDLLAAQFGSAAEEGTWLGTAGRFFPAGWADLSVAFGCEWEQKYLIDAIDVPAHRLSPGQSAAGQAVLAKLPPHPTNLLIKVSGPTFASLAVRNAQRQAGMDEALTACALERYFLDHHAYPTELAALVPMYLSRVPSDVIDGAPLRYRPTADGRYRLWEVGWNGRDEGGAVVWKTDGKHLDAEQGNWVWQYERLNPPSKPSS